MDTFEKQDVLLKRISTIFMVLLFSVSGLTFFNFLLAYTPLREYQTAISLVAFVAFDLILYIYCLRTVYFDKAYKYLIILAIINLIYIFPYLISFDFRKIVLYLIFTVPYSVVGFLLLYKRSLREYFFKIGEKLQIFAVFWAILYIAAIYRFSIYGEGILAIRAMTYGNIAWFFLTFYFINIINFVNGQSKNKVVTLICLVILAFAICCTGLRTGMLSMIFAPFLMIIFLLNKNGVDKKKVCFRIVTILFTAVVIIQLSVITVPKASRMTVVEGNITYDIEKSDDENYRKTNVNFFKLSKSEQEELLLGGKDYTPQLRVYDVKTDEIKTIKSLFKSYILKNDCTEEETENILYEDIRSNNPTKIIVHDINKKYALSYEIHRTRGYLWEAALNEWEKAGKLFGNGILHFQNKYVGTFPHNIFLEALSDIGLIFTIIIVLIVFIALLIFIKREKNEIDNSVMKVMIFALSYVPGFFFYTSLYSNGSLIFLITILVIYFSLKKKKHGEI